MFKFAPVEKSIKKELWALSIPVIFDQLFSVLMGTVNILLAGKVGEESIAGVSLVDSVNSVMIALLGALAIGGTVVISQYLGRGNGEKASNSAMQSLVSGTVILILVTIPLFILRAAVLKLLYGSVSENVMIAATDYYTISIFTYPIMFITQLCYGVLRASNVTKVPMYINIVMNVINLGLGYALVLGGNLDLGLFQIVVPKMGAGGTALANLIARALCCIFTVWLLSGRRFAANLNFREKFKLDLPVLKSVYKIGLPASGENVLFMIGKLLSQTFVAILPIAAIAASNVASSLHTLAVVPLSAMSAVSTIMVGQKMGANDHDGAKKILAYSLRVCYVMIVSSGFIFALLGPFLCGLYSEDQEVIRIGSNLLKMNFIAFFIYAPAFIFPSGFRGAGDVNYTMITSVVSMWLFRVVLAYLFGIVMNMGVYGIWLGMYVDWIARAIIYTFRFKSGAWLDKKVLND